MAKLGSNVVQIKVTSTSTTGSYNDISDYVREFSGLNTEAILQPSHAFADSWEEVLYTGINKVADITLKGYYDDVAATGPHALFGTLSMLGGERSMKLNFGTTNTYPKFDFLIKGYNRMPKVGELTGFEIICAVTGAVTLVTT